MNKFKIILTGATGMVGEGVLLHCIENDEVAEVLVVGRRSTNIQHPKLKELLLKDFNTLNKVADQVQFYDACFYCAGISSIGMNEQDYTQITYSATLNFAKVLLHSSPNMVFNFVSGAQTKSDGKQMWQRVKGRTEEALTQMGFRGQYNFRPGIMKSVQGQKNVRWFFKPLIAILSFLLPKRTLTLHQVGQAMINSITKGYNKHILEVSDIKLLADV